jgi:hypothetical protein
VHPEPLYNADQPGSEDWVAMVTDDRSLRAPFPSFTFADTSWFNNLAHLAWEHAMQVE